MSGLRCECSLGHLVDYLEDWLDDRNTTDTLNLNHTRPISALAFAMARSEGWTVNVDDHEPANFAPMVTVNAHDDSFEVFRTPATGRCQQLTDLASGQDHRESYVALRVVALDTDLTIEAEYGYVADAPVPSSGVRLGADVRLEPMSDFAVDLDFDFEPA